VQGQPLACAHCSTADASAIDPSVLFSGTTLAQSHCTAAHSHPLANAKASASTDQYVRIVSRPVPANISVGQGAPRARSHCIAPICPAPPAQFSACCKDALERKKTRGSVRASSQSSTAMAPPWMAAVKKLRVHDSVTTVCADASAES
jgi:hypothetical protein